MFWWLSALVVSGLTAEGWTRVRLVRENDRLRRATTRDSLTGLLNRDGLQHAISVHPRSSLAVLFLDLDRFKAVNDTFGHAAGDHVVASTARRIERCRPADVVGRLGGDEFVVLVDTDRADPHVVAQSLAAHIAEPIEVGGRLLRLSTSIGIAHGPWTDETPVEILATADVALRRAKEAGRDRIETFSSDLRAELQRRQVVEARLQRAIETTALSAGLDPEVDSATGRVIGARIVPVVVDGESFERVADLEEAVVDANILEHVTASAVRQIRPFALRLDRLALADDFRFRIVLPTRCTARAWRDGRLTSIVRDLPLHRFTIEVGADLLAIDPTGARAVLDDQRRRGARLCLAISATIDWTAVADGSFDEVRLDTRGLNSESRFAVARAAIDLARRFGLTVSTGPIDDASAIEIASELGVMHRDGPAIHRLVSPVGIERLLTKQLVGQPLA